MKYHYRLLVKKLTLLGIAIFSIVSLDSTTAIAKHRAQRYKYRISYVLHHKENARKKRIKHHRRYIRESKHKKQEHAIKYQQIKFERVDDQGSTLTNNIRNSLFYDINQTRLKFHRRELKPAYWLQKAADYRAPHVQYAYEHYTDGSMNHTETDNWIHGYDTHVSLSEHLHRKHIRPLYTGENACDYIFGGTQYQSDWTLAPYNNGTASGIAANVNDDLMYHDMAEGNDNGHRENELDPRFRYLAVGVRYNPQRNYGSMTEEFAS